MSLFRGDRINVEIIGSSHAEKMSVRVVGMPCFKFVGNKVAEYLKRRTPKGKFATERKEKDEFKFIKGLNNGLIDGEILAEMKNSDVKKDDYADLYAKPRPSHADYVSYIKDGTMDFSGGGRFSGRLTSLLCVAGGIVAEYLESKGIFLQAEVCEIGGISYCEENFNKKAEKILSEANDEGDSVGAVVSCKIKGVPAGLGNDYFEGLESKISSLVYAIPGAKGVEFGKGFAIATLKGSEANDELRAEKGKIFTTSNFSGGINGGISNGEEITLKVAFRPTPSISKTQNTVDLLTGENTKINIKGRHDVCFALRTPPVVESAVAIAILDEFLKTITQESIKDYRSEIDKIDDDITALVLKRMEISGRIGRSKAKNGEKAECKEREKQIIKRLTENLDEEKTSLVGEIYETVFDLSKKMQEKK